MIQPILTIVNTPMTQQATTDNQSDSQSSRLDKVYTALAIDDDGRLCKDIPDSVCDSQPQHFFTHIGSLTFSKLADSLVDPKLILSWLLSQLGTSSGLIGFLVPVREAGALLPQLFFSEWIRTRPKRKWVWAAGAAIQGLSVLLMLLSVIFLPNKTAGVAVLLCLALLAVARSFCSVSYKDVLAKTLSKSTRGTATGMAGSLASAGLIVFTCLLIFKVIELKVETILVLLGLAGGLWLLAAANFIRLKEQAGSTDGGQNGISGIGRRIVSAFSDKQFVLFLSVRGLLIATALAPPFLVMLLSDQANFSQAGNSATVEQPLFAQSGQFGFMLLASALASLTSSFWWGKLADRSSRKVLMLTALLAMFGLLASFLITQFWPEVLGKWFVLPLLLFVVMVAYQGVRLGRSTHLVDMANDSNRANFTAVSNTAIGLLMFSGAIFGWLAQSVGIAWVLFLFSIMCAAACLLAFLLKDVQSD